MTTEPDMAEVDPLLTVSERNLEAAAKRMASKLSIAKRIACECEGLTMGSLCRRYLAEEKSAVKSEILSRPIVTRSDALAVVSLLERHHDPEIAAHLLQCLHSYLAAA
jgi:hypothetical protein